MRGAMVRAILEGRKTQTRRLVKPQPQRPRCIYEPEDCHALHIGQAKQGNLVAEAFGFWWKNGNISDGAVVTHLCKYGLVGDRLWVKETFKENEPPSGYIYRASDSEYGRERPWKPSIFMPRQASRLTLEITSIRVERLKDISEEDAIAEGIEADGNGWKAYRDGNLPRLAFPQNSYKTLWESINGAGSWDLNPWVWVISFSKL